MRFARLDFLDAYKEYGVLFVRLAVAFHLIYGVLDNIVDPARMAEFEGFLTQFGFPAVSLSARLSVWAQFLCAVAYLLGAATRYAAAVMVVNFLVAIGMVHWGRPYPEAAPAVWMLSASLFLLVHGPGRLSVDGWFAGRVWSSASSTSG